ncbi:MAG: chemotaxis protein CheW [Cyanobacteria bacterium J06623_5]
MSAYQPTDMTASACLLQRPMSAEYLAEQTAQLATALPKTGAGETCSAMIFRLGREWFALPAGLCVQVLPPVPAHTLPHRSNSTLLGVVNVRGQMLLKVSLIEILGLTPHATANYAPEAPDNSIAEAKGKIYPRMMVVEKLDGQGDSDVWVFEVDELDGIHAIGHDQLESAAAGIKTDAIACTSQVFLWQGHRVNYLEDEQLFEALRQRAL